MAGALRGKLIDALEPRYAVVNKPGPGIARMRIAITGVKLKQEERVAKGVFGVLPIRLVVNAVQSAAGRETSLDKASVELEVLDSATRERLVVAIDPDSLRHANGEASWDSLSSAFELYAKKLRERLDKEHGTYSFTEKDFGLYVSQGRFKSIGCGAGAPNSFSEGL